MIEKRERGREERGGKGKGKRKRKRRERKKEKEKKPFLVEQLQKKFCLVTVSLLKKC